MTTPTYKRSIDDLYTELNSSKDGLTHQEAIQRHETYGPNEIVQDTHTPVWLLFLSNSKDPMVIVLLIVAVVQIVLGEIIESSVILGIVIISAIVTVVQERKAADSLESLRQLSAPEATVLRDGTFQTVNAAEIVPGDVIALEVGDHIPADGRLLESNTLQVDEGALTGESLPVHKHVTSLTEDVPLGDRVNMVFSSTLVTNGRALFLVTHTGNHTEMGKIAQLIQSSDTIETPLQRKLARFSVSLGWGILGLSVFIFVLSSFRAFTEGTDDLTATLIRSFMFAVAVAVAAIPEALQSIVTIVLSTGTNKMAKNHAIIRHLPAVETLGSTSIICTDKTGTLTQNKMTVVDAFLPKQATPFQNTVDHWSDDATLLMHIAVLANDSYITEEGTIAGDPTEAALILYSNDRGNPYDAIQRHYPRISELPFDSDRKLMSTLHNIDGRQFMLTKGAPDVVFSRSQKVLINGEVKRLTDEWLRAFTSKNESYATEAKRVLAFAYKPIEHSELTTDDEQDLILVGLMAMIDPPREEVAQAVAQAKGAGIRTIMITGDHKTTARAIAQTLGIFSEGDIALTGQELDMLSTDELMDQLERISVYARVSPENKIRIVHAWQAKGHITAMTGDGVNDAPALKQANIGIAMGSGTDVSKDASAMILTDDNFVSIVNAVEVGRNVYNNIKKSISYLFSGNLGAVGAIIFALLFNMASPFTALQLLFINLANDALPAIALGLEPGEPHVMEEAPRDPDEGIFAGGTLWHIVFRGVIIALFVLIAQFIGNQTSPELGIAMAFSTLILSRTLQVFPSRSSVKTSWELGMFSNRWVLIAFGVCLTLYASTLLPVTRDIFSIPHAFGATQLFISAGLALTTTLIIEFKKILIRQ